MKTSEDGILFISKFEGIKLTAYQDSVGIWTIGAGHIQGVKRGDTITLEEAYDLLHGDVMHAEDAINKLVKVPLTQNEYDSLVSWVFNLGEGNLRKSTMLAYLNTMQYKLAADEMPKWSKAGGRELAGLLRRREAERKLFLEGAYE